MRLLPRPPGDQAGGSAPFFGIDVPSGYVFFSGGQNQIASSDGDGSAMSPWCVVCNNAAGTLWDCLPICEACYHTARYNREVYRARMQIGNASAAQAQARADAQALKDQAYQAMAQALALAQEQALVQKAQKAQPQPQALVQKAQKAQAQGIAIDQQRPLITLYPRHAPRPSGCRYCGYRHCGLQPTCETCCRLMKL
ncbi:uncharacterized protein [Triticum aestivum]|uniref:uncharacterized protein n=1 Tax=Triticum aestivum TaxID=4565 RepID=UPI001D02F342|nr:uncharacterized protein LOC123117360 [Triticum aestivum]